MDKTNKPTLAIVPDIASRMKLQDRDLAEKREAARRDVHDIILLWSHRLYQARHTEPPQEIA